LIELQTSHQIRLIKKEEHHIKIPESNVLVQKEDIYQALQNSKPITVLKNFSKKKHNSNAETLNNG
jgi:phage pi2 protein 07